MNGTGRPLLARGMTTGILGGVVVAAWFLLLDVIGGRPFFTPAALGSALFLSAQTPAEVSLSPGIIAGYTALHFSIFIAIGVLFAATADYLEQRPRKVLIAFLAALVLEALMLATLALMAEWVLGALGIWAITMANVLAVAVMLWWSWRTHPVLRHELPRTAPDV
jgi:hypothetical protein